MPRRKRQSSLKSKGKRATQGGLLHAGFQGVHDEQTGSSQGEVRRAHQSREVTVPVGDADGARAG